MPKKSFTIKPLRQKTITIKMHNGFVVSPHTTNLRATANPLGLVEPYQAPTTDMLWNAVEHEPKQKSKPIKIKTQHSTPRRSTLRSRNHVLPSFSLPRIPSFTLSAPKIPSINLSSLKPRLTSTHLHHAKALISFLVIGVLIVTPIPAFTFYETLHTQGGTLANQGKDALTTIAQGSSFLTTGNFTDATRQFNKTLQTLTSLESEIKNLHTILPFVSHITNLTSGAQDVSLALINLSKVLEQTNLQTLETPGEALKIINDIVAVTTPRLESAVKKFNSLDTSVLPDPYQNSVLQLQHTAHEALQSLETLTKIHAVLLSLFNEPHLRRYLLIFQNDAELRPTGGFIGSIAFLDVADGKIVNLEIPGGGPYDFKGTQKIYEKPPKPLALVSKRWELQDANWSPDFAVSAQEIMRLLEGAKGPTVDGVVAINASLIEQLLRSLPPIEISAHGVTVDSTNFIEVTQNKVEKEYDKTVNKPKQFIADLAPEFLKTAVAKKDAATLIPLMLTLSQGLVNRDVQLFAADTSLQKLIQAAGLDGKIQKTAPDSDYVMVVNSNVGGGKTDRVMEQKVTHTARIHDDGSQIVTITVSRTHHGTPGTTFYGATNNNYMRVYVPQGSTLLEAHGFSLPDETSFNVPEDWYAPNKLTNATEHSMTYDKKSGTAIYTDEGKTVFANWSITKPGETTLVRLTYKLPFSARLETKDTPTLRYTLYRQKQSGVRETSFVHNALLPNGWHVDWNSANSQNYNPSEDSVVAFLASQQ